MNTVSQTKKKGATIASDSPPRIQKAQQKLHKNNKDSFDTRTQTTHHLSTLLAALRHEKNILAALRAHHARLVRTQEELHRYRPCGAVLSCEHCSRGVGRALSLLLLLLSLVPALLAGGGAKDVDAAMAQKKMDRAEWTLLFRRDRRGDGPGGRTRPSGNGLWDNNDDEVGGPRGVVVVEEDDDFFNVEGEGVLDRIKRALGCVTMRNAFAGLRRVRD